MLYYYCLIHIQESYLWGAKDFQHLYFIMVKKNL